jgi:adenylate cyclase
VTARNGGEAEQQHPAERGPARVGERAQRADAKPELVATAKLIRGLLPGDESYGDALSTSGPRLREQLGRQLSDLAPERPSALRELGLGVLQAWQALSEAQQRRRGTADTAILFTDLVGFSTWALDAGDEAAVDLLRRIGKAEESAISERGGIVVKRLGDGSMAVFSHPEQAVTAVHDTQSRLAELEVEGYEPRLRAGVHLGRPRRVGKDYLGVDVNIAARVGDAAKGGEVLVSETACEMLEPSAFKIGRRKRLKATGAPEQLVVRTVKPS